MKRIVYSIAPCLLLITGCNVAKVDNQRFVLVNDPTSISDKIPGGALALDTKTGQLCYTLKGDFTSSHMLPMCSELAND